ncbi:hypothetical protein A500_16815 [Clostridium sartagoforme AAU1]|uniref:Uncharacterized protein n=1 Tax=Clostridium sartagoforme AAU1 TaxID=1202534 RepID=R9BU05_9CLOT|nr:hypothetical protein [Clostridium sartagoforme]EOR20487.1 hypothetical protein A500_16815 [Clostridium sartagoforme AAU1]
MTLERIDYYRDLQPLYDQCKKNLYYHSILTMTDGSVVDGIIEDVDNDSIVVLVGEDVMEQDDNEPNNQQRDFYRRPRRRYRRFRRRRFPLGNLAALSLLAYPFYAPPYPYYPYY